MIIRAGRPGLIGSIARTAVVAGTAQAVAGRVNHRQQQRWAAEAAPAPGPVPAPTAAPVAPVAPVAPAAPSAVADPTELVEALRSLAELRDQGVLTDAEFAAQKARLLG